MKKILFVWFFLFSATTIYGQGVISEKTLANMEMICLQTKSTLALFSSRLSIGKNEDAFSMLRTSENMSADFDKFITKSENKQSPFFNYRSAINSIFQSFDGLYFYSDLPIEILKYKNEQDCIYFNTVYYDKTFNTVSTTSRQRVSRVIQALVFPKVNALDGKFKSPIGYCGISACYSIKDFTNEYSSPREEFMYFIIPLSAITQYATGNITQEELVDKSDIFLSTDGTSNLSKIKVVLE